MVIWTLAKKDLRLLLRDARAMVILLAMPLIFILVLGVSLGEGWGKKPDDTLRVSVVILDRGLPQHPEREPASCVAMAGALGMRVQAVATASMVQASRGDWSFPYGKWADLVAQDLRQTAKIRVEVVESLPLARELVH